MELKHLRNFIAVADLHSFTKAADAMYVSQPTLSQNISALEEELGVKLLVRNKRTVGLTPAGRHFVEGARDLFRQMDDLMITTRAGKYPLDGLDELTVGFDENAVRYESLRYSVTCVATAILEELPGLRVHYRLLESGSVTQALGSGDMDIVFASEEFTAASAGTERRNVHTDEIVLATHSKTPVIDSPESIRSVLESKVVSLPKNDKHRIMSAFRIFDEMDVQPDIMLMDHNELIPMFVGMGRGCMLVKLSEAPRMPYKDMYVMHFGVSSAFVKISAYWNKDNDNTLLARLLDGLHI